MTAVTAAAPAKIGFGRVIQGVFGVLARNFVTFLILTVVLLGVPAVIVGLGFAQMIGGGVAAGGALIGVGYLVMMLTLSILQAALIHTTVADLNGRRATVAEGLSTGLRHALPILGVMILFGLGVAFGAVLLIVPGIMLAVAWFVAIPSQVVERTGVFGAFSRSGRLTKDNRWRIFGLLVLWWIAYTVIQTTLLNIVGAGAPGAGAVGAASGAVLAAIPPAYWVVLLLLTVANTMISGAGVAVIYYELRRVKEGVGPEALAAVFD